jgi:hypothetical protein
MKAAVVDLGHVGKATAACVAYQGHHVCRHELQAKATFS